MFSFYLNESLTRQLEKERSRQELILLFRPTLFLGSKTSISSFWGVARSSSLNTGRANCELPWAYETTSQDRFEIYTRILMILESWVQRPSYFKLATVGTWTSKSKFTGDFFDVLRWRDLWTIRPVRPEDLRSSQRNYWYSQSLCVLVIELCTGVGISRSAHQFNSRSWESWCFADQNRKKHVSYHLALQIRSSAYHAPSFVLHCGSVHGLRNLNTFCVLAMLST